MKTNFVIYIIFATCLISCQRIIDLNLDSAETKIVIQGNIYNEAGPFTVKITKTVDFDKKNEYPPVLGAFVTITDKQGIIDTLIDKGEGNYVTKKIQGIPGNDYTLSIRLGDIVYTSTSSMPDPVNIDSIYIDKSTITNDYDVFIDFKDPENIDNYYRVVKYINTNKIEEFYTISDDLYEGDTISYSPVSMGMMNRNEIESGDVVTIWLETIDKNVYEYFRTAGGDASQSASPSNPTSNINNGALGYFCACSVSTKKIKVPLLD